MAQKLNISLVKEAIVKQAKTIKRRREIFEEIKKFDKELSTLDEVAMVGSFGFAAPKDASSKTSTGFENPQPLSRVQELMAQMNAEENSVTNESPDISMDSLKEENERLKKELEELKTKS